MSQKRLLVVEDDPEIAALLSRVATDAGFIVRAATGPVAIEKAYADFEPDVITLDIMMPDMDGVEVLQFLRRQFSAARIVILSGSDGVSRRITENLGKALGLVIEANLVKPFRIAEVRAILETIKNSLDDDARKLA